MIIFWENTNSPDESIDTVNSEEQMEGSHITEFHTPEDEEIVPVDFFSEVNQHFDNQHDWQLMAPKHVTKQDPSVDGKLANHENETILSVAMQDQDHTDIMNGLRVLVGSDRNAVQKFINDMIDNTNAATSQSKPSMPRFT